VLDKAARVKQLRKKIAYVLWGVGSCSFVIVACIAWLLKDGLGPDASESHSWNAVGHFLPYFIEGSLIYCGAVSPLTPNS
jgi:hypothetical protein